MTIIKVASPAGSGMNFALNLLRLSFHNDNDEFIAAGHERTDILDPVPTLVILRNPYDAIASGTERHLKSSEHSTFKNDPFLIEDDNMHSIVGQLQHEKNRYLEFFKDIEFLKHIKVLTFDLLVEDPDKFVQEVAKHFNIKSEITKRSKSEVIQAVIDSGNKNRIPRKTGKGRMKIDLLIRAMYPGDEFKSLAVYLDLKEKVDKGLI